MNRKDFENEFFENGFVVLRTCIDTKILDEGKAIMSEAISKRLGRSEDFIVGLMELLERETQHELQQFLFKELNHRGTPLQILKLPEVLEKLMCLLGPDLCYLESLELAVNIKGVKKDYYLKKWHQEFWSGMGIHTVGLWFPISIEENMGGAMEFIPGSHHWGHIPHRNREPLEIPDVAKPSKIQVIEGDAVMFHSLTLHRTEKNESMIPRIAVPLSVKNFYTKETGVPEFKKWQPFNF